MSLPYRQIHLDFHTPSLPFELAKDFDKNEFQTRLKKAHVNSITLAGRCHHGYIYYDSQLPAKHPQMKKDFLMEQIDACHEIGVRAPIYLTVGWDAFSADNHPEWLERKIDGSLYGFEDFGQLSPGWKTLCFNTPYLDYLKEQISETIQHFGEKLDGLFFDIVWQDVCYCNNCTKKMIEKGYDPQDETLRGRFAKETELFLKEEIYKTVQQHNHDLPIFFNEGNILPSIRPNLHQYGHLEIESLPSGEWGYQHFPTVARYAKNLGKDYVGMTGKFHKVWADFGSYKNQAALEYECFLALAHGSKCSIGDQMYPQGTLQKTTYELIGKVYEQVERLESYNDDTSAVTEIAIVHPGIVQQGEQKVDLSLAGAVNMLNEEDYQFDIVDQMMDWQKYRLLILPDKITLTKELAQKIEEYLKKGGKILATYQSGLNESKNFLKNWGINYVKENPFVPTYGIYHLDNLPKEEIVLHGKSLEVELENAQILGEEIRPMYQRNFQHYFSHFQAPIGEKSDYPVATQNNEVIYFSHPLFEMYKIHGVQQYKQMVIEALVYLLDGKKIIQTNLPKASDVIVNKKNHEKEILVNLLYYVPERKSLLLDTIEDKVLLKDYEVELDISYLLSTNEITIDEVKSIVDKQNLEFNYQNGKLKMQIPQIHGYQIIKINYN
ncbi:MAG: beta-galactosidase trimerization domain-containing protein [Streptococcaceae bacterium]|jgi:hypothetical protein|nr:beta-galactosidase trimerization domain-containing protein [Streptococcaceae bacterium]